VKEVTMTRRLRLWITAVLTMAATALMVGLTVAAQAGVHQAQPNPPLAGITFNAID
jgi:thiol:disulfide interchange protein